MKAIKLLSLLAVPVINACSNTEPTDGMKHYTPISITKAEAAMTADANALGFRMFAELEKGSDEKLQNRFISPLSLSLALALCTTGADSATREEMSTVLGFEGQSTDEMGAYFQKMISALRSADSKTTFTVANAIWASKDTKVLDSYIADASKWYDSEVHMEDFSKASTLKNINDWCSRNTSGKIPSILDQLSPQLRMVLLNALYFNGKWADSFPDSFNGTFTCTDGRKISSKMMCDDRTIPYYEDKEVQAGELTYGNGAFVMDIILPREGVSIAEVMNGLDATKWDRWMSSMFSRQVYFEMPVFKMEHTAEMSDALQALGMPLAFSDKADFSKMCTTPLCIDFVKQKTYIDVNEKGTEAAAVTAIGMKLTSAGPSETIDFIADRPFIFAIRERSTGAVLFLGWKTM